MGLRRNKYRMRALRLLLLVGLALTGVTGCGDGQTPASSPAPRPAGELTFYNWDGDMPQSVLDAFTREFAVKVNYVTYESQDEALANMRAGKFYDVVVVENRLVPVLVLEGLLSELDFGHLPNFKNIAANFRDLVYDPGNRFSVPYNWGITGLVVRGDLVAAPVTRWRDLWDPRYAGRVAVWMGVPRDVVGLTLKSLGYSANSEDPVELEAALQQLNKIRPHLLTLEDFDPVTSAKAMSSGAVVLSMGYAVDVREARQNNEAVQFVLPAEGPLLWGDNFVIPANSPNKPAAERFLNFILRPEIGARIASLNSFATPNEAAWPLIDPDVRNDPVVFPTNAQLRNAELILNLSPAGRKLHADIWARFLSGNSAGGPR
jgi:spermidine/putrescine transport system substrate-binding protein